VGNARLPVRCAAGTIVACSRARTRVVALVAGGAVMLGARVAAPLPPTLGDMTVASVALGRGLAGALGADPVVAPIGDRCDSGTFSTRSQR
jgi:hypothetical protein